MLGNPAHRHKYSSTCLVGVFLSFLALSSDASLDRHEVTHREYMKFVQATGHPPPEYWNNGRIPGEMESEPVVLVSWYDAVAFCQWAGGKRLPTVEEWMGVCEAGKLQKDGDVWEWTSTEVSTEEGPFKALCGPLGVCDCSHRYRPHWKNMVKGFRCTGSSLQLTSLPLELRLTPPLEAGTKPMGFPKGRSGSSPHWSNTGIQTPCSI